MKRNNTYKEPIVIEFPGMIARVFSPELTAEEKAQRMKTIHKAAESLLRSAENEKRQKTNLRTAQVYRNVGSEI